MQIQSALCKYVCTCVYSGTPTLMQAFSHPFLSIVLAMGDQK